MDGLHVLEVRAMGSAWICRQSGLTQMDNHNHTCVTAGGCCSVSCVVGQKHRGNLHQFHRENADLHRRSASLHNIKKKKTTAVRPIITAGFWRVKRRIQHVFAFYDLLPTSQFIISQCFQTTSALHSLKDHHSPDSVLDINIRLFALLFFIRTITQTSTRGHTWWKCQQIFEFSGLDTGPQEFFVASLSPWFPVVARQMLLSNEGRKRWGMLVHLSVHLFRPDWNNPQFFRGFNDIF